MSSPSPAPIFANPNAPTERELVEMRSAAGRVMDLEENVCRGLNDLKSGTRTPVIKGSNSDGHRLGAITEDPLGEILLGMSRHKDLIEGLSKTGSTWSTASQDTLAQYQAFLIESAKKVRTLYETNLAWKGRADGVAKNMDSIAEILGRLTSITVVKAPNPDIVSPPSTIGKAPPRGGEVKTGSASQEAPLAQAHRELSEAKRELQERIEDVKRLAREADLAGTRISELETECQQLTYTLQTAESARIDLRQDLESQLTSLRDSLRKKEASLQTANEAIAKLDDTVLNLEEKVTQLEGELEAEKRKAKFPEWTKSYRKKIVRPLKAERIRRIASTIDLASAKETLANEKATHELEIQKAKEVLDLAQKDHEQAIAKLKLEQEASLNAINDRLKSEVNLRKSADTIILDIIQMLGDPEIVLSDTQRDVLRGQLKIALQDFPKYRAEYNAKKDYLIHLNKGSTSELTLPLTQLRVKFEELKPKFSDQRDRALMEQCVREVAGLLEVTTSLESKDQLFDSDVHMVVDRVFRTWRELSPFDASPARRADLGYVLVSCDEARLAVRKWLEDRFALEEILVLPEVTAFNSDYHIELEGTASAPPNPTLSGRVFSCVRPGFLQGDKVRLKARVKRYLGTPSTTPSPIIHEPIGTQAVPEGKVIIASEEKATTPPAVTVENALY